MSYKYAQLNIHDPHISHKTGEILIQPGKEKEESDLYILIEIDSNTPEDKQLIKQFLEIIFESYEKTKLFEVEKSLEKILHEINQNLPALLPKKIGYLNLLHCFVGLYQEGFLTFSVFGNINVYLIKPTGIKKINDKATQEKINKIFNFTLSGNIKDGDRILITTESLTDYISLEKIKKIVSTLPPSSSIAHFANILQATLPHVSFFSIILTGPQIKEEMEKQITPELSRLSMTRGSKSSLDELLSLQEETEKILKKPSFLHSLKNKSTIKTPPKPKELKSKTIRLRKFLVASKLLSKLLNYLRIALQIIIITDIRKKIFTSIQQKFSQLIKKINQLPKFNKALFFIIIVLLLLLTQNLIYQSKKSQEIALNQQYNEIVQQIESKQNSIEASLIYNDISRAKQLLEEINQLLNNLPLNTKNQVGQKENLIKSTNGLKARIWKTINIIEPTILYDFRQLNLGAQVTAIALKDNLLYGLNSTDQLFLYNIKDNQGKILNQFNYKLSYLKSGPNNLLIGLTPEKKFFKINQEEFSEINVSSIDSTTQVDDLTFYLDKMYLLDKRAKQILRFTYYGNDFHAKQSWVKEDLPINNAVSLTIDGYVYVLLNNGEILKLATGRKQDFPKITIEPEITLPLKIFTTSESNYLYLLDPQNQRFIIINKNDSGLKNQYYSQKFTELKDFLVNEKERKVYLLNGSQIMVVGI